MKVSSVVAATLIGVVGAAPLESRATYESDNLTKQGVVNLGFYVKKNGYPNPQECTLDNTAQRKEW